MREFDGTGLRSDLEDLDIRVEEMARRIASLEKTVGAMRVLGEDFWRAEAAVLLTSAAVKSWQYDARDDNTLFLDIFACELTADGSAKRWVGKSGELGAAIGINRAMPLVFSIQVVEFLTPELAGTFNLEIDGEQIRWSAREGNRWSAPIKARPGCAQLQFRAFVDNSLVPNSKDVSFSIAKVRIAPALFDNIAVGAASPAVLAASE